MQNPPCNSRRFEPDPSLPSPALRLRGVDPTSFRSSLAAMAGAKQPRRYRLPAILAAVVAAALLLFSPAVGALEKGTNRSSLLGQPRQWSTGTDEAEILAEAEARGRGRVGGDTAAGEQGGEFESLDSMLQWAIGTALDFSMLSDFANLNLKYLQFG